MIVLPQRITAMRPIGDKSLPYWTASSADGVELLLEPEETLLDVRYCRVSQANPGSWNLPDDTTLIVTDRRVAFLTTRFDTGGGWVGFGAAGLAVAATANAMSKRRAAGRSAGKVAVGQIRHEWLTSISLRRVKALIGIVDTYIDLTCTTASGPRTIGLWGRKAVTGEFARWLVATACRHCLALTPAASAESRATLERYIHGDHDRDGTATNLRWSMPGQADELIAAALAAQPGKEDSFAASGSST